MAQDFDQRDFDTHHDQLLDPPDGEPVTVDAELLPETCKPPATGDFAGANFPVSQSEYERLTQTKRQTTAARIAKIDGALGRLGSCLDDQKRITEQGHQWLTDYTDAQDKTQYLDDLRANLQAKAMAGGSSLAITTAASQSMNSAITTERERVTAWNADLDAQWQQAMASLQVIANAQQESENIAQVEQEALDRQLDLECMAELAQEAQDRAARKAQRKAELRTQLGLA
ncbi:MAG: hypothetical protein AAGA01_12760 [Cyanobacteria bacterium P01_E01_bin.43]